jgi:diphosphomevalonate decarboxylase
MQNYTTNEKDWPADRLRQASGQIAWESPSNIALIKYWGKFPGQLPMNPSLSFALRESVVRIRMTYSYTNGEGSLNAFLINGKQNESFRERIEKYLHSLHSFFPFLPHLNLDIDSSSTFPHSAGIASSAAAFSALALCLCSMEARLEGRVSQPDDAFYQKASFMARLGSGSACRSVYGGLVLWGKTGLQPGASDEYAIPLNMLAVDDVFYTMQDAVLIVDEGEKKVSSSAGHAMMANHPYRDSRVAQVEAGMQQMFEVLKTGNMLGFADIIEREALSLHGLMMSSDPGFILMRPNTIRILEKIRDFRRDTGLAAGFTLDAGPNVHLIYFEQDAGPLKAFIKEELIPLCYNDRWIDDGMGKGPVEIKL